MPRTKQPKPLPPSTTPLWSRLSQKLARAIASGEYPVGSLLPTEHQLMAEHAMSRHTVRAALAELVSLGLISRTPHTGTRVISNGRTARFYMEMPEVGDIDRLAVEYPRCLTSFTKLICDEAASIATGFALQTPLIRLEYIRRKHDSEKPISYTSTWLRDTGADILSLASSNNRTPLITVLERYAGVRCVSIDQSFSAVGIDIRQAEQLERPSGTPAMLLRRDFMDSRQSPIIVAKNYYPEGCFTYMMRVCRQHQTSGQSI
ncbi:MAG: GntR family transcriptional regulator [Sutterella sp.]|nr:GntR family transcriptional regulator [Sutterella sp.]